MRIAVIDDEYIYLSKINHLLRDYFPTIEIDLFVDTASLIDSKEQYDLVLLDIELVEENGLEFAKVHRLKFFHILFVSSHTECVYDAFGTNIMGFVMKNKLDSLLIPKIKEVVQIIEDEKVIRLRTTEGIICMRQREILYFVIEDECIFVQTLHVRHRLTITSLKKLQEDLNEFFIMTHRNMIVNMAQIHRFFKKNHGIELITGEVLSVSDRNWKALLHAYNKWMNQLW